MNSKLFVTKEHIAAIMAGLKYTFVIIPDTTTTICSAVHPNGFTLALGESACVCPENFNVETGQHWAKEDAMKKAEKELWKLEGYRLKHKLTEPTITRYIEAGNEKVNNFLSFGDAVVALESGYKVARAGWNGKNMWLKLVNKGFFDIGCSVVEEADLPFIGMKTADNKEADLPFIGMKTADNKFVPWLASQTDILAKDWVILSDE